ncbi:hypothetical protein SB48_HM08orf04532 [Heyndrickxia coagulans]|uniref:Uncharacterized protein n=1 Tax=Heyndrickxia coagulans TaxID=1398 RepID=A0AAN0WCN6_HEYCO|nr:hypothetical protein SB48_HM08orf04532 [Heyndrickxia coagulans]
MDVWKGGISAAAVHCKQVPVCPKKHLLLAFSEMFFAVHLLYGRFISIL